MAKDKRVSRCFSLKPETIQLIEELQNKFSEELASKISLGTVIDIAINKIRDKSITELISTRKGFINED